MITHARVRELFEYRDGYLYWRIAGKGRRRGRAAGRLSRDGYWYIGIDYRKYLAHRLIWMYHYGVLPDYIDHIDRNRANNQIENLRACTNQQNAYNANMREDNTSGCLGVGWHAAKKKWRATITIGRAHVHLGNFLTKEEAKDCYDRTTKEWAGDYFTS